METITPDKSTEKVTLAAVDEHTTQDDYVIDKAFEARTLRKIDFNLILVFGLLYMMSFLDRSVIGNANLTGFSTDLGLKGNQYGAAVSMVYATYVTFEPIWTTALKVLSPRYVLTGTTLVWSALTVGSAFVKNFNQLAAVRILLGLFEAGCIPCISLYLTMTYNRNEYGWRLAIIDLCSATSGAFGGLLAYGLSNISAGGLHGWQWLYIVEGLLSFCLVPLAWWRIPNVIGEASWLNEDEKALLRVRAQRNKDAFDSEETFSWASIRAAAREPRLWLHACMHFGIDSTLYSLTTFLPTLIAGMGFSTKVQAQLLTVPVYFVAAFAFMVIAHLSDKFKLRGPFLLLSSGFCLLGYIVLATCESIPGRYCAVFIAALGLYAGSSLNVLWAADNFAGHYKRAFSMGTVQLVGNSAGACMGFIFTTQTSPRYYHGLIFDCCFTAFAMTCCCILMIAYRIKNKRNAQLVADGALNDPTLGDKNPHYVFFN